MDEVVSVTLGLAGGVTLAGLTVQTGGLVVCTGGAELATDLHREVLGLSARQGREQSHEHEHNGGESADRVTGFQHERI